ncbi:MAG: HAD-IA family hydrolase [Muribaculaceae bacterium]|nr:HAD-IA family hydrolase [Muribaculaceae bacterium]
MGNIKHLIFDFDGTLVDTAALIVSTMKAAAKELGLDSRSDADYRSTIGVRLEQVPQILWPENEAAQGQFAHTYRRRFDELSRPLNVECFDGVKETLAWLSDAGFSMAIASSRNGESLREYLKLFGITGYFSVILGGDDVRHGKPSPEPVLTILERCGWSADETLTVGDAPVDIVMGREAGTLTCAVTYGNGKEKELRDEHPCYIISSFETLIPIVEGVSPDLVNYVEHQIIPCYDHFDKAHRRDHVRLVIRQSLSYARHIPALDINMVYCIAAFHDMGLRNGRENHHTDSGKILENDSFILERFTPQQIQTMKYAVEDHRASGKNAPRNEYGKVVADADRFIDPVTIIRRTIQYGLANYPDLDRDGHFQRTLSHLEEKYGPQGYIRIWLPWSDNMERLRRLHGIISDRARLTEIFNNLFDKETE